MNTAALHDVVVDHMTTISLIVRALPHLTPVRAEEFLIRLERSADRIIDATEQSDAPPPDHRVARFFS